MKKYWEPKFKNAAAKAAFEKYNEHMEVGHDFGSGQIQRAHQQKASRLRCAWRKMEERAS